MDFEVAEVEERRGEKKLQWASETRELPHDRIGRNRQRA